MARETPAVPEQLQIIQKDRLGRGQHGCPPAGGAPTRHITGWKAGCCCAAGAPVPAVVLDPFAGSGTAGVVAGKLRRDFAGIDLAGGEKDLGGDTANQRIEAARRELTVPLAELAEGLRQEELFDAHAKIDKV